MRVFETTVGDHFPWFTHRGHEHARRLGALLLGQGGSQVNSRYPEVGSKLWGRRTDGRCYY